MSVLDKLVAKERPRDESSPGQGSPLDFPSPEPWPDHASITPEEREKARAKKAADQQQQWRESPLAADRERWRKYREWEDKHFPLNEANPLSDPPGMAAARRKFELWAREMRLRDLSRGAE